MSADGPNPAGKTYTVDVASWPRVDANKEVKREGAESSNTAMRGHNATRGIKRGKTCSNSANRVTRKKLEILQKKDPLPSS